jgi:hypothetical protein
MTPAELTALEAELRYTAAARAMRHSATTPTGYYAGLARICHPANQENGK